MNRKMSKRVKFLADRVAAKSDVSPEPYVEKKHQVKLTPMPKLFTIPEGFEETENFKYVKGPNGLIYAAITPVQRINSNTARGFAQRMKKHAKQNRPTQAKSKFKGTFFKSRILGYT